MRQKLELNYFMGATTIINQKIYIFMCVLFSVFSVTSNLVHQKFVYLSVCKFFLFEISCATLIYPLTFLLIALITEFYSEKDSKFCIHTSIIMNLIIFLFILLMCQLNATQWSRVSNQDFNLVFKFSGVSFFSSVIACYISQFFEIYIYINIKKITNNNFLWIRNNLSIGLSLFVDTCIFISLLTLFGAFPREHCVSTIINVWVFKLFFTIFSTSILYALIFMIKFLQKIKFFKTCISS